MSARGKIKQQAEDFQVSEILGFELTGEGEHLWCYVEKRGMNTAFVKRQWAKLCGCPPREIAHSGLKDRHAVTRQWLSLPARFAENLPSEQINGEEYWRIVERAYHQKKLRVGSHRQNRFVITLREVQGDHAMLEHTLAGIRDAGFANTFGDQRFGQENLDQAMRWVERGVLPKKPDERGRVLSTLRSAAFNAELAARQSADLWQTLLPGDRAMLSGTNSHFAVEAIDDELRARCASGDIAPAGWLPGKGEKGAGEALTIREAALQPYHEAIAYLCRYAESGWRALSVRPYGLCWQWLDGQTLQLEFALPRGSFATALLAQVMTIEDSSAYKPAG